MGYEQLCRRIPVHATTSQNPVKILRSNMLHMLPMLHR